jgi:DNA repair ATPase RecN
MDFNEAHYEKLQQRSFDIMNMLKKYQMDEDALIAYHESLSMQLSMANNYDDFIKDANKTLNALKEVVVIDAKKLSEQRATAVSQYLMEKGIKNFRLSINGFGELLPKYINTTDEGRLLNRRVEFLITANEKMKADAEKEAGN